MDKNGEKEKTINQLLQAIEEDNPGDYLNATKAEIAWIFGIDPYSDEYEELMNI